MKYLLYNKYCTYLVRNLYVEYLLLSVKEKSKQKILVPARLCCQVEQTRSSTFNDNS